MAYDESVGEIKTGRELSFYFEKVGYKHIAIHRTGYIAETLVEELKNTDIRIDYGIDKNAEIVYADIDIFL